VLLSGNFTDTSEPLSQLTCLLGSYDPSKGIGAGNYGRCSGLALDKLLAAASVALDDGKRAELIAQAYDLALGQDVATDVVSDHRLGHAQRHRLWRLPAGGDGGRFGASGEVNGLANRGRS
jgi:hypothetical protein